MRLIEITTPRYDHSDVAEIIQRIDEKMPTLPSAQVEIVPYLNQIGIKFDLSNQEPVTVYYALNTPSEKQFRNQLFAALISDQGKRNIDYRQDIMKTLNRRVLRRDALDYLTNPKTWHRVDMTYNGVTLPFTKYRE